jgi:hypothetical protein
MNISNALRTQLENFGRHRYANLDNTLKDELSVHYKALGFGKLNKACATCVRVAMDKLNENKDKIDPPIKIHEKKKGSKIHFIGKK